MLDVCSWRIEPMKIGVLREIGACARKVYWRLAQRRGEMKKKRKIKRERKDFD